MPEWKRTEEQLFDPSWDIQLPRDALPQSQESGDAQIMRDRDGLPLLGMEQDDVDTFMEFFDVDEFRERYKNSN